MDNKNLNDIDFISDNANGSIIKRLYSLTTMKSNGEINEQQFIDERRKIMSGK